MHKFEFERGKMVPVPSHSIVPERDVNSAPVLEALHLGASSPITACSCTPS